MSIVYENSTYRVVVSEDESGYELINVRTGVLEMQGLEMPRLLIAASEGDNIYRTILDIPDPPKIDMPSLSAIVDINKKH